MTTYKITNNEQYNSTEIYFNGKPSAAEREALKGLKFRWNGKKLCWYGYAEAEAIAAALSGSPATPAERPKQKKATTPALEVDKTLLAREFSKCWTSEKMVSFCVNRILNTVTLDDGTILTIEKQHIKTDFCFGESGFDAEEAAHMAAHARTSADYFKKENLSYFDEWLYNIEKIQNNDSMLLLTYSRTHYTKQPADCKIGYFALRYWHQVLNDLGGSANLDKIAGQEVHSRYDGDYFVMTPAQIDKLKKAFEEARKAHEKKVDAYIKRYGTSKVHSWTYWRDA